MDSNNNTPVNDREPELNSEERKIENMKAINADTLLMKRSEPESDSQSDPNDETLLDNLEAEQGPRKKQKVAQYKINSQERAKIVKNRKAKPLIQGCNSIENYVYLNKIHEGSFGIVFRASDKITGEFYAIKNVKIERNSRGFPYSAIREIKSLLSLEHPNIIKMREVVTGSKMDKIYVVMEYMANELKNLMENLEGGFTASQVKCLMKQLLLAVDYLHTRFILHRDLKTSNLLISKEGVLKVCDFGLARKFSQRGRPMTPVVVTLWYRAPELLLGCDKYGFGVDMWSVGCIFAEMVLGRPLFPGKSEFQQLEMIFRCLGMPNDHNWPGFKDILRKKQVKMNIKYSQSRLGEFLQEVNKGVRGEVLSQKGFELLSKMLHYDPKNRISARDALNHPWFREEPKGCLPSEMPKYRSFNTISREKRRKNLERQRKIAELKRQQEEMERALKEQQDRGINEKMEIIKKLESGDLKPVLPGLEIVSGLKVDKVVLPSNLNIKL